MFNRARDTFATSRYAPRICVWGLKCKSICLRGGPTRLCCRVTPVDTRKTTRAAPPYFRALGDNRRVNREVFGVFEIDFQHESEIRIWI